MKNKGQNSALVPQCNVRAAAVHIILLAEKFCLYLTPLFPSDDLLPSLSFNRSDYPVLPADAEIALFIGKAPMPKFSRLNSSIPPLGKVSVIDFLHHSL